MAERSSDSSTLPAGTHIGRTALRVSDLEEVAAFYRTVVGLEQVDSDGTTATLGVDGTPLLVLLEDEDTPGRQPSGAGLFHNAFRVPSREALGDALARVRERWHLDGASDHAVSEALYLADPEGNGVEIYCDFPREAWPVTDDGTPLMTTDRLDLAALEAAATGAPRAPPGTDVGHVHLEVTSLAAFEACYVDTLGFEVQTTVPAASFVSAGGYHHHVGANTWNRRTAPVDGRGLAWFEVVVPDAGALAALESRVEDSDVPVTGATDGLEVVDPDGATVRLRVADTTPR